MASIAASAVSVGASSSGVSASMRATSTATLPLPTTTALGVRGRTASPWKSGWALYQATKAVAGHEPGRSSPGNADAPVGLGADGVDDGVVEAGELGMVEIAADLDVAEKAKTRPLRDALEHARDRLDVRVVGRDAQAYEPPRRRQPVEQVDLDGGVGCQQLPGGIEPRRPRADDGDS